jgi:5'-methylthioadenosine phosphorylase
VNTFFTDGIVAHVAFAEPFCPDLNRILYESGREAGVSIHPKGTFVVMEGPAFSTRAESRLYRSWGADLIGMTALPEAKLAREAEICYTVIGCATDYDSWWERGEPVTVDIILGTLQKNVDNAKKIIKLAVGRMPEKRDCPCATALQGAIVTAPDLIPPEQKRKLELLIGKYIR